jgi:hypothetical protein
MENSKWREKGSGNTSQQQNTNWIQVKVLVLISYKHKKITPWSISLIQKPIWFLQHLKVEENFRKPTYNYKIKISMQQQNV